MYNDTHYIYKHMIVCSKVGKIPIYYRCDVADQCSDLAAFCQPDQLRCLCKEEYHVIGDRCGR